MKQYRLLRNNKESGPYTAAQLIEMGLKPYDLVWADGRSAAWRYPCEIDEFKAYAPAVEEQPFDRFFKKPTTTDNSKIFTTVEQPSIPKAAAALPNPKPRIRVKADWNQVGQPALLAQQVVSIPKAQQPNAQAKQPAVANTSWESQWLDWQQEKKAVDDASKQHHAPETINSIDTEPVIETKFAQSLDSLKQRYVDTVLKAKGQAATSWYKHKATATLALLAVPVLGFGIWLGSAWHGDMEAKKPAVAVNNITPTPVANTVQQVPAADANTGQVGIAGNTGTTAVVPKPHTDAKEVIPDIDDDQTNKKEEHTPAQVTAKKTQPTTFAQNVVVVNKHVNIAGHTRPTPVVKQPVTVAQPQQRYAFTAPSNTDPNARNKTVNPALLAARPSVPAANSSNNYITSQNRQPEVPLAVKPAETAAPIFTHYTKKQKIEDFVSVEADESSSGAIQNLALNVENVTDARIDLVVIDVQYYDANGKFKTGQTMYVKNIPEDETVKVRIPDNAYATRVKYKVSLVSVEQKGVYLVAE